jgi:hypothetical protein
LKARQGLLVREMSPTSFPEMKNVITIMTLAMTIVFKTLVCWHFQSFEQLSQAWNS